MVNMTTLPACSCLPSAQYPVLLFYQYIHLEEDKIHALEEYHNNLDESFSGKIRISSEGYNITISAPAHEIIRYKQELKERFDIQGNEAFWKETNGCQHIFHGHKSIKICQEITPFGTKIQNHDTRTISHLEPEQFHKAWTEALEHESDVLLLDARNQYETQFGGFPKALSPPTRRFSEIPKYLRSLKPAKKVLMYCTGGIRCEKTASYLQEIWKDAEIHTLDGGIVNYLAAFAGKGEENLFKGRNFVFDDRGTHGGQWDDVKCHNCDKDSITAAYCIYESCMIILPNCNDCTPICCSRCAQCYDDQNRRRNICECERQRIQRLEEGQTLSVDELQ